jgi:acetolactate synthase-1/2/3 large subunit
VVLVGLAARRDVDAAAVRAFCSTHRLPAFVTYKAKGVVPDSDPHFAGVLTNAAIEQPILEQADLFIGVGLDPVELIPRPWIHAAACINCVPWRVSEQHIAFTRQIVGDVPDALGQIGGLLSPSTWDLDSVHRQVETQRSSMRNHGGAGFTPASIVGAAARAAGAARVTVDAGAHMFPATMLWPVANRHGMLISNGLSTMGFALPAAIGAAAADRDRPVVALTGDGGLLICAGELLTAARERLRIVTIVFGDASLSLIAVKQQQRQHAAAGVALGDIRWAALAESVGVRGHVAADERQLDGALSDALAHDGPSLIDARIDATSYAGMLRTIRGG